MEFCSEIPIFQSTSHAKYFLYTEDLSEESQIYRQLSSNPLLSPELILNLSASDNRKRHARVATGESRKGGVWTVERSDNFHFQFSKTFVDIVLKKNNQN